MQPQTIGRYTVRAELGSGGFATVYRAYDPNLDRELALKVLHPHLVHQPDIRARFIREGRALARVRHPNLVLVYEAGEAEATAYLALELVDGRTLEDVVWERGSLALAEVVAIADQVAGALAALHARKLVHRDVKPANIMIERNTGRAVLLDLGVMRDLTDATVTSSSLIGTPSLMAPEQVLWHGQVTPQTDVYQLGASVFVALSGQVPFRGDPVQVFDAIKTQPPPNLHALRPDLPATIVAIVAEAMSKDPARRPPGPQALAAELGRVAQQAAASDPMNAGPTVPLPRPQAPPAPGATESVTHRRTPDGGRADTQRALTRKPAAAIAGAVAAVLGLAVLGLAVLLLRSQDGDGNPAAAGSTTIATAQGAAPPQTSAQTAAPALPVAGTVTTFAGGWPGGFADGPIATAQFGAPPGLALGADGTLYVADQHNHRVRAISPAGAVSTVADLSAGGQAPEDQLVGVAVDGAGVVYFIDRQNHLVYKVAPGGSPTVLAGSGRWGFADGVGTQASFASLGGIAVDAAGAIYVTDEDNHALRRITPAGEVSTVAGSPKPGFADGLGTAAQFSYPVGVAADAAGTLYVADAGNHAIRRITPTGDVTTLAGTGEPGFADGPGRQARFNNPWAVTVDGAGNVYVADKQNHRIRRIAPDGMVTTVAGGAEGNVDGPIGRAQFSLPMGVAVDRAGAIYVADVGSASIRKIVPARD
ncbi:MAG: protein kinase domain-containing protein [Dehalococcoidia bacterium]